MEEKARRIYSWVQQSIKYIAFEQGMEGFVPGMPTWYAAVVSGIVRT